MGVDKDFGVAFAKSQLSAGVILPSTGSIFISVSDADKPKIVPVARKLRKAGFTIVATSGTMKFLADKGIEAELVYKIFEGRPNVLDLLTDRRVGMMINTPMGKESFQDDYEIRRSAIIHNVPYTTTIAGAIAATEGIIALAGRNLGVTSLQEYHAGG